MYFRNQILRLSERFFPVGIHVVSDGSGDIGRDQVVLLICIKKFVKEHQSQTTTGSIFTTVMITSELAVKIFNHKVKANHY